MKCPKCNIEAIKSGAFWMCQAHGLLSGTKPLTPLRIFLSYGHDNNEELVLRIKTDLEKRGHDVWFDKKDIAHGDNWRCKITEGILNSNRVLSILSKYSTRDPGVCLDEIAIAVGVKGGNIQTVIVENELEVNPPVNIGYIQWLDMHDWKERRTAGSAEWETWYQAKFAEIARVVESDESRRFSGEIETLSTHLKPIRSDARIYQLLNKGFYGRQWLFEAVETWRKAAKRDSRLFWINGGPGVGKSAFAAQLTHKRGDTVIAAQFCEWDKPDHCNAQRVIRSLAFQLATRLPEYRKLLQSLPEISELDRKNSAELFDYILSDPLKLSISGGRERQLIVIDALDEAGGDGHNELVEVLARCSPRLPKWLGIVITSRPEKHVTVPLQGLNPLILDTASEANRADIRNYLQIQLEEPLQKRPDAHHIVEQILDKSNGMFLYAERFCEAVTHGYLSLERPERFPEGLGGMFLQYFQRQFPDVAQFKKEVRPALGVILAAREPLPLEVIRMLFNWQEGKLRDFIGSLGSLFPVTNQGGHEVVKSYHKALADWLIEAEHSGQYFVDIEEGHNQLAGFLWGEYKAKTTAMSTYGMHHVIQHLITTAQLERVLDLLTDINFVRMKYLSNIKYDLINDYLQAVSGFASDATAFGRVSDFLLHLVSSSGRNKIKDNSDFLNVQIAMDVYVSLADQTILKESLAKILLITCRHGDVNVRSAGILALFRVKRKSEQGYEIAISVLRQLADQAVRFGIPYPQMFETTAITALGLFLEDPANRKLQNDLRSISCDTISRIILLKPVLWFLPKIAVQIMKKVPSDYNVVNVKEILAYKKLLASDAGIRIAVENIVDHIDPSFGSDDSFRAAWKAYLPHLLKCREGFLSFPLTIALLNRALTGSNRAQEDIYECFQDLKESPKFGSYDAHWRIQMIQLGRRLTAQAPLSPEWVVRAEEVLSENYRKGFRPQGLDEYIGGFGGAINALVRHTGNMCLPILEKIIQKSLLDREAQEKEGVPREKQRDMIIARELEINGVETGSYDPLARGWALYGLSCFLDRREMLDSALLNRLAVVGRKLWLYYPHEFQNMLRGVDKGVMDDFMASVKNAQTDSNLGELISVKTETFFAMLYSEPVGRVGAMRPRMLKFLRSLFSAEPLETTLRLLTRMIFDELLC